MKNIIAAVFLSIIAAYVTVQVTNKPHEIKTTAKETTYERVMRTGTIRCGYMIWPPATIRNEATGEMSGIMVEYIEALGKVLNLKIDWSQELNLATYLEDLNTGKIDLECSGGWPNALRGKKVEYSMPFYFLPMYAYGRVNDNRFDNNYKTIDMSDVTIATSDGGADEILRQRRFPHSGAYSLPQVAQLADRIIAVTSGKADLVFIDSAAFLEYDRANPGKLRQVKGEPLRVMANNLSFAAGDFRLQQMLNTATNELLYDGMIDRILDKYEPTPGTFLHVAKPYEVQK